MNPREIFAKGLALRDARRKVAHALRVLERGEARLQCSNLHCPTMLAVNYLHDKAMLASMENDWQGLLAEILRKGNADKRREIYEYLMARADSLTATSNADVDLLYLFAIGTHIGEIVADAYVGTHSAPSYQGFEWGVEELGKPKPGYELVLDDGLWRGRADIVHVHPSGYGVTIVEVKSTSAKALDYTPKFKDALQVTKYKELYPRVYPEAPPITDIQLVYIPYDAPPKHKYKDQVLDLARVYGEDQIAHCITNAKYDLAYLEKTTLAYISDKFSFPDNMPPGFYDQENKYPCSYCALSHLCYGFGEQMEMF